jgi:hypothetical protein
MLFVRSLRGLHCAERTNPHEVCTPMLDVHLPHKLHGFGEFLLHLFTISVGLLIATQIESCVEWRHSAR